MPFTRCRSGSDTALHRRDEGLLWLYTSRVVARRMWLFVRCNLCIHWQVVTSLVMHILERQLVDSAALFHCA